MHGLSTIVVIGAATGLLRRLENGHGAMAACPAGEVSQLCALGGVMALALPAPSGLAYPPAPAR